MEFFQKNQAFRQIVTNKPRSGRWFIPLWVRLSVVLSLSPLLIPAPLAYAQFTNGLSPMHDAVQQSITQASGPASDEGGFFSEIPAYKHRYGSTHTPPEEIHRPLNKPDSTPTGILPDSALPPDERSTPPSLQTPPATDTVVDKQQTEEPTQPVVESQPALTPKPVDAPVVVSPKALPPVQAIVTPPVEKPSIPEKSVTPPTQTTTAPSPKINPSATQAIIPTDKKNNQTTAQSVPQGKPKPAEQPIVEKANTQAMPPGGDVLFNDAVMTLEAPASAEADFDNPHDVTENKPVFTFQAAFGDQLQAVDQQYRWIQDALETSVQLGLHLPVKEIQKKLLKAYIYEQKAKFDNFKGKDWDRDYDMQLAQDVLNDAQLAVMPSNLIEGRAIWVDRGSIVKAKHPRDIQALMRRLHRAGLNVIYFETLNAGYPVYPSKILPQNPLVNGWDPLQVAIDEAHKLGMELHAWVWCFAVGNTKHNPIVNLPEEYPGPILQEAGLLSEALRMKNGSIMPPRQTEYWLSPSSQRARNFLVSVYKEVVQNYDVDGVQLDYIRYPFQRPDDHAGYEAVSANAFHRDTGLSLASGGLNLKAFVAWKTLQVSQFVEQVSNELRAIKPNLKISAAVFPMSRGQRLLAIQQDWETWIRKGWVDALNPMIYTTSPYVFRTSLNRVVDSVDHQAMVYPGVAIFRLDPQEMLGHIQEAEKAGANGSTLFANAQFDKEKQELLEQGPYKDTTAKPPHREPLIRLSEMIDRFLTEFQQVEVTSSLPYDRRLAVNQAMTSAKAFQQELTLSNNTAAALQKAFEDFKTSVNPILIGDREEHPYQSSWFGRNVSQMEQLLKYQAHRQSCCLLTKTQLSKNQPAF